MKLFKISLSLIFIIVITLFISCTEKTITEDQLQNRNELYYAVNDEKPFSGKVVSYYSSGQLKEETHYKDGLEDGLHIWWNENGVKWRGVKCKDGERISVVRWDENGKEIKK